MDKARLEEFANRLREEKRELAELRAMASDDRKPVELDQASVGRLSRVDAMQRQAMAGAAEQRRLLRDQVIDAALTRIANGSYGYCVKCDDEIVIRRLELDPAVATCVACAAKT